MTRKLAHEQERLFIIDEQFVVVQNYEVIRVVDIDEEKLKAELEKAVPIQISTKKPSQIFMSVVSDMAEVPFKNTNMLIKIDANEPVRLNLHDNPCFRKYQEFIQELPAYKKITEQRQKRIEGEKLVTRNFTSEYLGYYCERQKRFS